MHVALIAGDSNDADLLGNMEDGDNRLRNNSTS
jgi:hypothetical protein